MATEMVSTTLTYGKKRSLLRSLGSRRRQKYIAESFPTKKTISLSPAPKQGTIRLVQSDSLDLAISPINQRFKSTRTEVRDRDAENDDMASHLLDDTSAMLHKKALTRPFDDDTTPVDTPRASIIRKSASSLIDDLLMSPMALSPLIEKLPASPDARSRASRIEKYSPTSAKATRRGTPTRSRSDSAHKRKEYGLIRPLPQSRTSALNPLKSHPPPSLQPSSSGPLRAVDGNARQRKQDAPKPTAHIEIATADEINQKVSAMLAATNALKPVPVATNELSSSKFTRMVPARVFAKVSNAWDRFHSKTSQTQTSNGKFSQPYLGDDRDELMKSDTPPDSPTHENLSPISTIEIRLNEGDNLNKKKVQKIVGGQVVRKPVADDGKSLRPGKSMDDPFGEPAGARTPTRFESRLQIEAENLSSDDIPPVPTNPFESEIGFENDIEDRILSSTPVGSSTPRARVERYSISSSDHSPTKKYSRLSKAQVDLMLDSVTLRLGQEELSIAKPIGLTSLRASQRKLVDPVRRVKQHSITALNMDAHGLKRTKKHPSPSKEALEDLEMAFRKYAHLKVSGGNEDELDELASSFISTSSSLAPRDKNRLISNRLSTTRIGDLSGSDGHNGFDRPVSSPSSTRIPRPIENSIKLRPEIRLAPRFRPRAMHADDDDELQ